MSEEKQIEEIFKALIINCEDECEYCEFRDQDLCKDHFIAKALYYAVFRKQNEWISVDEKLPNENFEWVLVACQLVPEGWYGIPHIAELRHGVWYADCYDIPLEDAGVKVTHWIPLPEPPKMKGE